MYKNNSRVAPKEVLLDLLGRESKFNLCTRSVYVNFQPSCLQRPTNMKQTLLLDWFTILSLFTGRSEFRIHGGKTYWWPILPCFPLCADTWHTESGRYIQPGLLPWSRPGPWYPGPPHSPLGSDSTEEQTENGSIKVSVLQSVSGITDELIHMSILQITGLQLKVLKE